MRHRHSHQRRRDDSDSYSSSSYSDDSSKRSEDLYSELKHSLIHNDRYAYQLIRNINRDYGKYDVGVLRVTLEGSFSFCQKDLEDFFGKYGKI